MTLKALRSNSPSLLIEQWQIDLLLLSEQSAVGKLVGSRGPKNHTPATRARPRYCRALPSS